MFEPWVISHLISHYDTLDEAYYTTDHKEFKSTQCGQTNVILCLFYVCFPGLLQIWWHMPNNSVHLTTIKWHKSFQNFDYSNSDIVLMTVKLICKGLYTLFVYFMEITGFVGIFNRSVYIWSFSFSTPSD